MKLTSLLFAAAIILTTSIVPAFAIQCVPYAREVSGINIKGDAWQWWNAAAGVYERGRAPKDGAVLVFSRQGSMQHGHVSVVTRVVSNRLVLVDHANWAPVRGAGRGQVTVAVPVLDVSPKNDWSQVRVWFRPSNDYGSRVYKAEGFVFNTGMTGSGSRHVNRAALTRAAAMFPTDKALSRYAEPAKVEQAKPAKVEPATAVAEVVKAEPAVMRAAPPVAEATLSHPSTDDLVKVAGHTFKPRQANNAVNDFIFN